MYVYLLFGDAQNCTIMKLIKWKLHSNAYAIHCFGYCDDDDDRDYYYYYVCDAWQKMEIHVWTICSIYSKYTGCMLYNVQHIAYTTLYAYINSMQHLSKWKGEPIEMYANYLVFFFIFAGAANVLVFSPIPCTLLFWANQLTHNWLVCLRSFFFKISIHSAYIMCDSKFQFTSILNVWFGLVMKSSKTRIRC